MLRRSKLAAPKTVASQAHALLKIMPLQFPYRARFKDCAECGVSLAYVAVSTALPIGTMSPTKSCYSLCSWQHLGVGTKVESNFALRAACRRPLKMKTQHPGRCALLILSTEALHHQHATACSVWEEPLPWQSPGESHNSTTHRVGPSSERAAS